jgi:hypothetical protein
MFFRKFRRFLRRLTIGAVCVIRAVCWPQTPGSLAAPAAPEGLKGKVYFIPPFLKLPNFDGMEPVGVIYTNPLFVRPNSVGFPGIPNRAAWFAIDYTGKIYIRIPGKYGFRLISDDGSKLYIDGNVAIDNDHGLNVWTGEKSVQLSGGMHRIRLSYFQGPLKHNYIALMLSVMTPAGKDYKPFDSRDFSPPTSPEDWKYGSRADFAGPPDPDATRTKLKDVIAAEKGMTNKELVALVQSAVRQRAPDRSLAKTLDKLTLSEKLDLTTIEQLQSEGAGADAVAALDHLREISAWLPAAPDAPAFQVPPRPSIDEQTKFFRLVSANALHYTAGLPDFICTETVRRFTQPLHTSPGVMTALRPYPKLPPAEVWTPQDVLTVRLTYFDNVEKYDLTLVNGRKTGRNYELSGGAISKGDFGTTLLEIFAPDRETKFQWDHWTHLRKRLTQVYSYRTLRERSHHNIVAVGVRPGDRDTIVAGRHGFIYADSETHHVMRITGEAESIQPGFPVTAQSSMLDYSLTDVNGRQFVLPMRAEQRMQTAQLQFKNVIEFHDYRKFIGETTISFGEPERRY